VDSGLVNQLRAQQRSGVFGLYMALKRYVGLAAVLGTLFFVSKGLWGFYAATILTELLAVTGLAVWLLHGVQCRPRLFSLQLYWPMLAFGIPMVGYELCSIVLALGDRYVLQTLLGAEAVGVYSAAYTLCEYVQAFLIASMGQAIMPMYMRLWEEKGEAATVSFLGRFLHYYVMLVLPIVAGLTAVGPELLSVLASAKYGEGAVIIPYVIAGMILDGAIVVTGAGLYIQKRTKTIMLLVLGSAALNLALNFVLVPSLGILGAAVATLVSYAALAVLTLLLGQRWLRLPFPGAAVVKFGLLSAVMYLAVSHIALESLVATLVAKVTVGAAVYLALVWFCDGETRRTVHRGWARAQRVA
jgi:O-antigen/teichoic acid export membrane protein